ncbi:MAG TPA: ATP-binding protein [Burkholderiaceae bacterium]|nr:ATP-binding protein [Burkholderiaceae bacterium]
MHDTPTAEPAANPTRVLLLAPTAADAALSGVIFAEAKLALHISADVAELAAQIARGAGVVVLTDDVLAAMDPRRLLDALKEQPPWSDLPLILLARAGTQSQNAIAAVEILGNVTVLERPVHVSTLLGAVRTALRARRRQYELRDKMAALHRSEQLFRTLSETVPSMIWTAAPDGTITYTNRRWLEYTGLTPEENAREWTERVLHPDDRARCIEKWTRALHTCSAYEIEVRNRRHDGVYRWFVTRAVPLRNASGQVIAWFGVTTDIHDQKQFQEQLREADRRKDEFLAVLAHELRNPLAPIRNSLEILRRRAESPAALDESRAMMERQVAQMVRITDDLLDVSRITRGKLELRREPIELAAVIKSALDTARPLIEAGGHDVAVDLGPDDVRVNADPVRLAQVFSNLLNNACKYMHDGGRIFLTAVSTGGEVAVTVRDQGIGIAAAALPTIFDMFTQADGSLVKAQGGLGIGLALAKQLVEMHGGRITGASDGPGKGSEFTVYLPVLGAAPAPAAPPAPDPLEDRRPDPKARRVLVVDDNVDAAESLSMLLHLMGGEVATAFDGAQAVRTAADFRPDVILLDIGMPYMDGYEAARQIRAQPWGKHILLAALTGLGQEHDRDLAREAGFDAHFTKPIQPADLERLIGGLQPLERA